MISFSNVSKQYGRQVLFIDADFQLNPGEKVGLVGPNGAGKSTLFRMIMGEEHPDDGVISLPKKLTVGYFRQEVDEMTGRPVLDEAIAGSGRLGDLHHELMDLEKGMADPDRGRRTGSHHRALRPCAGGVPALRRLRTGGQGPRLPSRPGLRGRPDRRRRGGALRRLEDARGHGQGAAREFRCAAPGRAHQPPGHRIHPVAGEFPQERAVHAADDQPRQGLHEPRRHQGAGDRRRRHHHLLGQLRFFRH